jgi:hypothetical protein
MEGQDTAKKLFGDTLRVRLVRLFAMYSDKEFSMADIVAKTKGTRASVKNELAALVRTKVLATRPVKNMYMWKLSSGPHSAALPLLFEVSLKKEENKRVEKLKKCGRLTFAAVGGKLFGDEFAPLDMVIVGTMKTPHLTRFLKAYEEEVGQEVQFTLLTDKEFAHRIDVRDRMLFSFFEHAHEVWYNKSKAELPV